MIRVQRMVALFRRVQSGLPKVRRRRIRAAALKRILRMSRTKARLVKQASPSNAQSDYFIGQPVENRYAHSSNANGCWVEERMVSGLTASRASSRCKHKFEWHKTPAYVPVDVRSLCYDGNVIARAFNFCPKLRCCEEIICEMQKANVRRRSLRWASLFVS